MKTIFAYPGSFTPPTFGHLEIVLRAAEIFPEVVIVCSTNEKKGLERWFSEDECKALWNCYTLPSNVFVKTFSEYSLEKIDFGGVVMIRGIRDEKDVEYENRVMRFNYEKVGIDKFFYLLAKKEFANISSSRAREAAKKHDLKILAKCVAPSIATLMLKKVVENSLGDVIQEKEVYYAKVI